MHLCKCAYAYIILTCAQLTPTQWKLYTGAPIMTVTTWCSGLKITVCSVFSLTYKYKYDHKDRRIRTRSKKHTHTHVHTSLTHLCMQINPSPLETRRRKYLHR